MLVVAPGIVGVSSDPGYLDSPWVDLVLDHLAKVLLDECVCCILMMASNEYSSWHLLLLSLFNKVIRGYC